MATASFSEKVGDDFIQCTICCYNFKKPKVLPCLHTFCEHCLQEWVQKNDGNTFPCPTCREQVSLPQNGVEGLKDNFFLASLVKAVTEHNKVRHGQDGLLCTTCDEGKPATSRCSECAEFLCEGCESAHRLQRATKGHTLFTFEELKTGKYDGVFKTRIAPPCSKHSGEILKLYCRTCETPICNECALFEHRDSQHDLKRIEEVATEKRKTILDLTPQCKARTQFFQQIEEVHNRLKEQLMTNTEGARQNVQKTVQTLIALVKEEGERLLTCIDTEETSRKKQIEAEIEGAQISLASAKSTCEFAETLAREGGDYEVVSFSQDLTMRLNDLTKPPAGTVDYGLANITVDYAVMGNKIKQTIPPLAQYSMPKSTENELCSLLKRTTQSLASSESRTGLGPKQNGRGRLMTKSRSRILKLKTTPAEEMQDPNENSAGRIGQSWSRHYGPEALQESDDECWEEDPRVKRLRANGRLPPARAGKEGLARAIRDFGRDLVVPQGGRKRPMRLRSACSSKDTRDYRKGYPGKRSNPGVDENYKFYMNNLKSKPDGDYIDNIHRDWWGDYKRLEMHHGYIQWLFPIREEGSNSQARELQEHEIKLIMENPEAHARILRSYEMMLDFYGMKLKDKMTGEIVHSDNWEERLSHLNNSNRNYLHITRMLKCLGEFGYEHLKAPFIHFVLQEALVEKTLSNTIESCLDYWLHTIVRKEDRIALLCLADQLWDVEPA
ncbi:uncharacterized protein LOC144876737 [Branchiostoma floridae x Branchiostoma japonicum]